MTMRIAPLVAALIAAIALAGCNGYAPGEASPDDPHVISTGDGWKPAPGYSWVNRDAAGDMRVYWVPGSVYRHLDEVQWPHVQAGREEGTWYPAPGYAWAHFDANGRVSPNDLTVAWRAGLPYRESGAVTRHLISAQEAEQWYPEPGYAWVRRDGQGSPVWEDGVTWQPGASYRAAGDTAWPNIHAAGQEGSWEPDSGYVWSHVGSDGRIADYAVVSRREIEEAQAREHALDERWAAYLKDIQAQDDYPNWPAPPYDLYQQTHR